MAILDIDDEFDEEEDDGLAEDDEDDNDVVFGNGPINKGAMVKFINKYFVCTRVYYHYRYYASVFNTRSLFLITHTISYHISQTTLFIKDG